jgi:hypothetical protein
MTELINDVNRDFYEIIERMDKSEISSREMLSEVNSKAIAKSLKITTDEGETKPFPVFIKPYFVDNQRVPYLQHATHIMMRILNKMADLYFTEPSLRPLYKLKPEEEELAAIDPGYPNLIRITRNDAFLTDDSFKFIEFNCDSPGGPYWADTLTDIIFETPVMKELQKKYWFHKNYFVPQTLDALLDAYRGFGGKKEKPFIAIVAGGGVTLEEFKAIARWLTERGYPSEYSEPQWLEYDGKVLRTNTGNAIDIIYRRGWLPDWTTRMADIKPLIKAFRDGAVCVANTPRTILAANKSLMAVMQQEEIRKIFTAEEKKVLAENLPWTRLVEEKKTTYDGKEVDTYPFIRENKESLVLKPYDMLGGKGVYVGCDIDQKKWEEVIEETTKRLYIAQEYVPIPEEKFPVISEKGLSLEPKKVNVNFYAYSGLHAGGMVRTSDSAVINISSGGGLTCIYDVGGRI